MKTHFTSLTAAAMAAIILIPTPSPAEETKPRTARIVQPSVQIFARQLELTEAQQKAWRDIQAQQTKDYSALFRNKDLKPQEKYQRNADLRKNTMTNASRC